MLEVLRPRVLWRIAALLPLLTSCSSARTARTLTVHIDSMLAPALPTIPGIDGGPVRPLATLTDASGITADFVENELLVCTKDTAALADLMRAASGTIVKSFVPAGGFSGVDPMYLLHLDPPNADAAALTQKMRELSPKVTGELRVSSQRSVDLMLAAALVTSPTFRVALNIVPPSASIADGHPLESSSGDPVDPLNGFYGGHESHEDYTPDVSQWSYMRSKAQKPSGIVGIQDIGVIAAWKALAATGKIENKVRIALLDGGILDSPDVPRGAIWLTPPGQPNPASCPTATGGSLPCPWHGTGTLAALAGVPDNGFGAAGSAGPVALPIIAPSPTDFWTYAKYILLDLPAVGLLQPKIMNLSFAVRIPEGWNWIVNTLVDPIFAALRLTGTLVFAAAGNQNADVDETDDIGLFKVATWIPCQSAFVVCVGALSLDSPGRASYSNWANTSSHVSHANSVDIYGPGTVWIPKTNGSGQVVDGVTGDSGTSVASPFVAGVAALIWASDPGLSAAEVESILLSTAHTGGPDGLVPLWVNAGAAVKSILGSVPPNVNITSPTLEQAKGLVANDLFGVEFSAQAGNFEDDQYCCDYAWTSTNPGDGDNGTLGKGPTIYFSFTAPGQRTITVKATDAGGQTSSASIVVNVNQEPPRVLSIVRPKDGDTLYSGAGYTLEGEIQVQSGVGDLCGITGQNAKWTSDDPMDGLSVPGCVAPNVVFNSPGSRTLRFTYSESNGASVQASVTINVVAPTSPVISSISLLIDGRTTIAALSNPTPQTFITSSSLVGLSAVATGGIPPLAYRWTWHDTEKGGCPEMDIGTSQSGVNWQWGQPDTSGANCFNREGTLSLYVIDSMGRTGSAWTSVSFMPPLP